MSKSFRIPGFTETGTVIRPPERCHCSSRGGYWGNYFICGDCCPDWDCQSAAAQIADDLEKSGFFDDRDGQWLVHDFRAIAKPSFCKKKAKGALRTPTENRICGIGQSFRLHVFNHALQCAYGYMTRNRITMDFAQYLQRGMA